MKLILIASAAILVAAPVLADDTKEDAQDAKRFTAERVFDLEYADDPQISPDGAMIVYVRHAMDKRTDKDVGSLWSIDVRTGAHAPLVSTPSSSPRWSSSGDRLLYMATDGAKPELKVLYLSSGRSFSVAQLERPPGGPVWSPDGRSIAFSMFKPAEAPSFSKLPKAPEGAEWSKPVRVFDDLRIRFDGAGFLEEGATHLYVVPADGGTPRQVTDGDNDWGSPAFLDDDTLLGVANDVEDADLDPIESEIYAIELSDLSRKALTSRDGPDAAPEVSPNGRLVAYLGYDDKLKSYQETDLYVMNRDGSGARNLTARYDRSIDAISWRPDSAALIAFVEDAGETALVSIDLSGGVSSLTRDAGGTSLGRPYAGGAFSVSARDGANALIAYAQANAMKPSEVAYLRPGGRPKTATDLNADVLPFLDLATIEEIKVKSSHDEREIEAWIAKPAGFKADGSYPLILEIHGGPFAMYGPFFAAEIQRYAAEGYVVVYVNPRGSTGYGEEFAQQIDLAYPGADYDDLMSVVDAVIAKTYVDPKRLFVTGGSGGGVLTAWIVGKTDRFAAAATVKPVINWTTMALAGDIGQYVRRHWMRAEPWEDRELYWRLSPLSLVGNVKTPTLVMVGEEDWRTPAWEAEQFYTALKMRKVDTALIRVPGSPHFIAARPSRLIAKVDNIMGWFAKYDPAKKDGEKKTADEE